MFFLQNRIMNKLLIYLIMLLAALLNSCGRKPATTMPDKGNDSIYTRSSIYRISQSDPERALALVDTAEMLNLLRTNHSSLEIMKSIIHFNGLGQPKIARYYSLKAYEDAELRKDTLAYMTNLINLIVFCHDSGDFAGCIRYSSEGIEFIHRSGRFKDEEGNLVMHIGMSQHALGMDKEAKDNMMRGIAICREAVDREVCWSNVQHLLYTMGETMSELGEMGDWQQAATMIPDLLKTNALHEQLESEAPEGNIDMYRFYTYAQCMEIYQHLGNRKLADEYYRKCCSTGFVNSPEGLGFIVRYLLWIEDYPLALHNIQIAKRAFLQNQSNEISLNKLLVNEVEALTGLGRYKEAADVSHQIIALKDTLFKRQQRDDAQELAVIYESGEKDRQIQKEQNEKRLLAVLVMVVIVALGAVVYHSRRMHRRNVSLVRSVQEGIACRDELLQKEEECLAYKAQTEMQEKQLEELMHPHEDNPPSPDATEAETEGTKRSEESEASESGEQLRWVLHEIAVRRLYLQPGITTKTMQEELHVPASLFGECFKEQTGRNFSEHINSLRMDYAAKMLTEYPNYTVDAIAKMCGIDSRQHFHRLFSEHLGITPSVFRKSHIMPDNDGATK
ncbi:transcriptional regulator, AraC family [Bacteroides helcogenes P 36-108]|uniref:Transcriptional regulator, AraC family n=2 Tax=Bacteroides helcogenes TaxID=290053 RepID=E6SVN8_BACT6|nr:transcriptional regulator, AraC family [Bacteroides helcogenes P 36-108]